MDKNQQQIDKKKGFTAKRFAAIIGIILLLAMYVVTLVAAIIDFPQSNQLFRACIGLTIAVPILLWIFIWAVGVLTHRKSIASMDILNSNPRERERMEEAVQQRQEAGKN